MQWFFLFLLLFIALILESTITTMPLVLIILFCAIIVFRKSGVFVLSFFSGLILDSVTLQTLGKSSIFFLIFLTAALLYGRKFEVQSIPFVFLFSFLGSTMYLWYFGYQYIFIEGIVSA